MRARTAKWFETTVSHKRQMDDERNVADIFVVDALTFGEAEEAITREMMTFGTGDFEVKKINPAAYGEVWFSDMDADDKWYKAKLSFFILDEKSGKEKRSNVTYLVQAGSFNGAVKHIEEVMSTSMQDYVIANLTETKILDVYEHQAPVAKPTEAKLQTEAEQ